MRKFRTSKKYSCEFKESMIQKVFANETKSIETIAKEQGMPHQTLSTWVRKAKAPSMTQTPSIPPTHRLSLEQKFQFLLQSQSLQGETFGQFLRQHGLFSHQLEQWKKEIALSLLQQNSSPKKGDDPKDKKILLLEKEIALKDKTLAEASILLLLKKKHGHLWEEDNEQNEEKPLSKKEKN
ncbi:MAG: transposase [Planctomycetota bacterium]